MIELSLDTLRQLSDDMKDNQNDDCELNAKYNININELEDIVSEYVDECYIENNIYKIFPLVTMSMLGLFALFQ